ncbi:adhesin [Streptomyces sp. NPDC005336]|uniref:adhesin n=1 Tax=unclassified Streptomyces TaxID=2593676 RepID=UPI0033A23EDC
MGKQRPDPWIIRETGVALGALLLMSGLVGGGALLVSPSLFSAPETTQGREADAGVRAVPRPSLILPTDDPALPEPTASGSASSTRSAGPGRSPHPKPTKNPASDSPRPHPTKNPAPVDPEPAHYSAWAGHGCSSGAHGGYGEYGRYTDGSEGWYTVDYGGYDGGSCDGSYAAVPMSGSRTEDHDNSALWWWSVGPGHDTCTIGVFVPNGDSTDVGGDPTTYRVLSDPQDEDSAYATFQVDQRANRGRLVDAGTYRVEDGRIAVRMLDRGQDWNDNGPTYAHHAAGQMKVTCQAGS